jgi:2-polyprenyl-3-methyl-5-hydroxy-6-metoxy-1,4-benzoquinol methylase
MNTLAELEAEINQLQAWGVTAEYADKQLHPIPEMPVISRVDYILARCKGLRVLNLGCHSGSLHAEIQAVATSVIGVDLEPCGHAGDIWLDLDDYHALHAWVMPEVDLIVAGEILEHLGNGRNFLQALKVKAPGVPVILTTPNAFAAAGQQWLARGYVNVHREHLAWYCPKTLQTLVELCGFKIEARAWYGGRAPYSEGLIYLIR